MKKLNIVLAALLGFATLTAFADVDNAVKLQNKYNGFAKMVNPDTGGADAVDGKNFYNRQFRMPNGTTAACASCHTTNPANVGKHIVTGKAIKPLSPYVNKDRFNDVDKVEDNFTKHCNDIVGTDCTANEKANYIAYLLTERKPSAKK